MTSYLDPDHLADVLRRATPEAAEAIGHLTEAQLDDLLDDDQLLGSEPAWTLAEVLEYTHDQDEHRFNPAPFCAKCSGPCQMEDTQP